MPKLNLPDSRFELPSLFHPGRQPQGLVKIDWDHPLTRGLQICVIGSSEIELVHGYKLLLRNSATKGVSQYGKHLDSLASTAVVELVGSGGLNRASDEGLTIYQFSKALSSDVVGTHICKRDGSSVNWQLYANSSTSMNIRVGANNVGFSNSVSQDVWTGKAVSYAEGAGSRAFSFYEDGALLTTGSFDPDHQTTTAPISIGARWESYPTTGFDGDLLSSVSLVWYGRELNAAQMLSIHNNPYQFLIPA